MRKSRAVAPTLARILNATPVKVTANAEAPFAAELGPIKRKGSETGEDPGLRVGKAAVL